MNEAHVYRAHVLECANHIEAYIPVGRAAFPADHKTQDAVIRTFEVIGESATRVSAAYRSPHRRAVLGVQLPGGEPRARRRTGAGDN